MTTYPMGQGPSGVPVYEPGSDPAKQVRAATPDEIQTFRKWYQQDWDAGKLEDQATRKAYYDKADQFGIRLKPYRPKPSPRLAQAQATAAAPTEPVSGLTNFLSRGADVSEAFTGGVGAAPLMIASRYLHDPAMAAYAAKNANTMAGAFGTQTAEGIAPGAAASGAFALTPGPPLLKAGSAILAAGAAGATQKPVQRFLMGPENYKQYEQSVGEGVKNYPVAAGLGGVTGATLGGGSIPNPIQGIPATARGVAAIPKLLSPAARAALKQNPAAYQQALQDILHIGMSGGVPAAMTTGTSLVQGQAPNPWEVGTQLIGGPLMGASPMNVTTGRPGWMPNQGVPSPDVIQPPVPTLDTPGTDLFQGTPELSAPTTPEATPVVPTVKGKAGTPVKPAKAKTTKASAQTTPAVPLGVPPTPEVQAALATTVPETLDIKSEPLATGTGAIGSRWTGADGSVYTVTQPPNATGFNVFRKADGKVVKLNAKKLTTQTEGENLVKIDYGNRSQVEEPSVPTGAGETGNAVQESGAGQSVLQPEQPTVGLQGMGSTDTGGNQVTAAGASPETGVNVTPAAPQAKGKGGKAGTPIKRSVKPKTTVTVTGNAKAKPTGTAVSQPAADSGPAVASGVEASAGTEPAPTATNVAPTPPVKAQGKSGTKTSAATAAPEANVATAAESPLETATAPVAAKPKTDVQGNIIEAPNEKYYQNAKSDLAKYNAMTPEQKAEAANHALNPWTEENANVNRQVVANWEKAHPVVKKTKPVQQGDYEAFVSRQQEKYPSQATPEEPNPHPLKGYQDQVITLNRRIADELKRPGNPDENKVLGMLADTRRNNILAMDRAVSAKLEAVEPGKRAAVKNELARIQRGIANHPQDISYGADLATHLRSFGVDPVLANSYAQAIRGEAVLQARKGVKLQMMGGQSFLESIQKPWLLRNLMAQKNLPEEVKQQNGVGTRFLSPLRNMLSVVSPEGKLRLMGNYERLHGTLGRQISDSIVKTMNAVNSRTAAAKAALDEIDANLLSYRRSSGHGPISDFVQDTKQKLIGSASARQALDEDFIKRIETDFSDPNRLAGADPRIKKAVELHDEFTKRMRRYAVDYLTNFKHQAVPADWGITEKGYFKHLFYNNFDVSYVDKSTGATVKAAPDGGSYLDAIALARDLDKAGHKIVGVEANNDFKGDPTTRVPNAKFFKMMNDLQKSVGVDPATGKYKLSVQDLMDDSRGIVGRNQASSKFMGSMLRRAGQEGYSTAYRDVMNAYSGELINGIELTKLRKEVTPMIEKLARQPGKQYSAQVIQAHVDSLMGRPDGIEQFLNDAINSTQVPLTKGGRFALMNPTPIRSAQRIANVMTGAASHLALLPRWQAAITNGSQSWITLMPKTVALDGSPKYYVQAIKDYWKPGTQDALRKAGILSSNVKVVPDGAGGFKSVMTTAHSKIGTVLNPKQAFVAATEMNKGVGYIYGFMRYLRTNGLTMSGLTDAQRAAAHQEGLNFQWITEFKNDRWNGPPATRNSVGKVGLQFQNYNFSNIDQWWQTANEAMPSTGPLAVNPEYEIQYKRNAKSPLETLTGHGSEAEMNAEVARLRGTGRAVKIVSARSAEMMTKPQARKEMMTKLAAQVSLGGARSVAPGLITAGTYFYMHDYLKKRLGWSEQAAEPVARMLSYGVPSIAGNDMSGPTGIVPDFYGDTAMESLSSHTLPPLLSMGLRAYDAYHKGGKASTAENVLNSLPAGKQVLAGSALISDLLHAADPDRFKPGRIYYGGKGSQGAIKTPYGHALQFVGAQPFEKTQSYGYQEVRSNKNPIGLPPIRR